MTDDRDPLALYLAEVGDARPPDDGDARSMLADWRADDEEIGRQLVKSYLGVVVDLAEQLADPKPGLDVLTMIQEGNLALLAALREYDAASSEPLESCVRRTVAERLAEIRRREDD
jgi:DNA-directed RNA polymerase specialized sigma subunit